MEDNQETPKTNKYRWKEKSRSFGNFSADGDVSEPELPFKSPHTLLNASLSRRTTKKTYAEAVSGGSGSEDEAEVRMRKKAAQQERHDSEGIVVEKASTVRSSIDDSDDFVTALIVATLLGNLRL